MVVETSNDNEEYYLLDVAFNPPLVGMVVETPLEKRAMSLGHSFNPPLVGMVVETLNIIQN